MDLTGELNETIVDSNGIAMTSSPGGDERRKQDVPHCPCPRSLSR